MNTEWARTYHAKTRPGPEHIEALKRAFHLLESKGYTPEQAGDDGLYFNCMMDYGYGKVVFIFSLPRDRGMYRMYSIFAGPEPENVYFYGKAPELLERVAELPDFGKWLDFDNGG